VSKRYSTDISAPAAGEGASSRPAAANKGRRFPPETLSEAEVSALIRAASGRAPTGVRNRALIVVLYRGGLRVFEALGLHVRDVDVETGTIRVRHGKGDHSRIVGIDPAAASLIGRWLEVRRARGIPRSAPLFCTLRGRRLHDRYVRAVLPRLARRAGIDKRVHPHGLRHTHAAALAREGVPVNVIQAQLGHRSLATTDRYLRHIAPEELVRRMRQRTWQAPGTGGG
jgi:site-specific recombinase XerD